MKPFICHVLPAYPDRITIQWDIQDLDPTRAAGVVFDILRSGSPGGEWITVGTAIDGVTFTDVFRDSIDGTSEENILSLQHEAWYRVDMRLQGGVVISSDPMDTRGVIPSHFKTNRPMGWMAREEQSSPLPDTPFTIFPKTERRLQLVQRSVQRRAAIALKHFSGVDVAVLKRRHFGKRCVRCYDPVSNAILMSRCDKCYGVGWEGGYFEPLLSTGRFLENPIQTQTEPGASAEVLSAMFEGLDFPSLVKDDIIIELDKNRRWVVNTTTDRTLRRRRITQHAQVTELSRTAEVYRVSIPSSLKDHTYLV